jgi:serine/threonine protein kinase
MVETGGPSDTPTGEERVEPEDRPPEEPDATLADSRVTQPLDSARPLRPSSQLAAGDRVGPYVLVRALGRGGMGEVWEADQQEPVRRKVALKLIRTGMDSGQFVQRFEAERQVLAMMDHPNIARIFDAGTTDGGSPYFVMEYVPGTPINRYCDSNELDIDARLRLFIRVCEGVQHAHQKATIHRDLKPGNVLVTPIDGKNMPKIIDFGVAKVTDEKVTDQTMHTSAGALIGTLEYMSPEQLEGSKDIDTRTDVYALGVILYELLIGELPFDSRKHQSSTLLEMTRMIRENDPVRPSTRLSQAGDNAGDAARKRRTDVRSLGRKLGGDLDWITMMALEKDRSRRYASPRELAGDVRRYLDSEPVIAGPPTTGYRMRKFARRHRAAVIAGGIVALTLVMGLTVATYGLLKARRAEAAARQETAKAQAVNEFLQGMLASANPSQAQGREVTVRELLDTASSEVGGGQLPEEREIEAEVRNTLGATYQSLGLYDQAEPHLVDALGIRRALQPGDSRPVAESLHSLGRLRWAKSDYDGAEKLIQESLDMYRRLPGDHADAMAWCLNDLAVVIQTEGDSGRAEPMLRETLALKRQLHGNESDEVSDTLNNLGWALHFQGKTEEAETLFREALEVGRSLHGPDHPGVLVSQLNVATILDFLRRSDESEAMYLDCVERLRRVLGPDHPTTVQGLKSLGELYLRLDRVEEARPLIQEALKTSERTLGPDHSLTITLLADMGWVHRAAGELAVAEDVYRDTLERRLRSLGPEHPHTLRSSWQLARILVDRGKFAEAELTSRPALEVGRRVLPAGNENLSALELHRGLALLGLDRAPEAEPLIRSCLTTREATLPAGSWETAQARSALGEALNRLGRPAEALPLLEQAYRELSDSPDAPPLRIANAARRLESFYARRAESTGSPEDRAAARRWRDLASQL